MDCLTSNKRSQGLEEIFQSLNQRRAELALILFQRLIESNTDRKEMEGLLALVWDTIQHSEISFERALLAGNAQYYRTLLKILFLGLRVHVDTTPDFKSSTRWMESATIIPIVMAVLENIVANGVRELATFIHDNPTESNPEDVALITGKWVNSNWVDLKLRKALGLRRNFPPRMRTQVPQFCSLKEVNEN
jgi:nuclear pore complex protein Nup188